ncbi:MAG TPA: hypothetical protein VMS60_13290 [Solirubrobacterales bacterium]|nr:hypothetical protein [Solirubrobacterales bacterium]
MTKNRTGAGAIVLLTAVALLLGLFAESAPAVQIVGSDGKVYACYKAKGKRKGSVRLVAKNARCKRGERKTSWSATGAAGANGQRGTAGTPGSGASGAGGAGGADGENVVGLESKVVNLTLKLDALENVLNGVTKDTLGKALDTVKGVTNGELLGAIDSVDLVDQLCTQSTKLTNQLGLLSNVVGGLGLEGVLGGLLKIPTLPVALPAFDCTDAT